MKSLIKLLFAFGLFLLAACIPACSQLESSRPAETPLPSDALTPSPAPFVPPAGYVQYLAQSGDTLQVVAAHFGIQPAQVFSAEPIPAQTLLPPGQELYLPPLEGTTTPAALLFPDSEVVFSPSASRFDMAAYVDSTPGKLKKYIDDLTRKSAVLVLQQFALEYSVNPRLLLTLLEWNGTWLSASPLTHEQSLYPFGHVENDMGGLYDQVNWVCRQLNNGYYGWRTGSLTELTFLDGSRLRLAPALNAGTVAVMYYLSLVGSQPEFTASLARLSQVHHQLFGDPFARAAQVEPLLPAGLKQPELSLPFPAGYTWNYTCGPHASWGKEGDLPFGALDFAPPAAVTGCGNSIHWATAMASGTVLSRPIQPPGLVIQELDEDGDEHTGWVLYYMHIAGTGRAQPHTRLQAGDRIGHPSCEGGSSTGIHVHVHRAYNGEFIPAVGGLPFVLSGYTAGANERRCEGGTLSREHVTVKSYPWGNYWTKICQPGSERCTMGTPTPRPTLTPTVTRTPRPTLTPAVTRTPQPSAAPSITVTPAP